MFFRISITGALLLASTALFLPQASAAESGVMAHSDMVSHSIEDRVRALQQQRFQQMPYLDKGFVRQTIKVDNIREREVFLTPGQKDLQKTIQRAIDVHTPVRAATERVALANRRILVAFRNLFPEAEFRFEERDGDISGGQKFNSLSYRFNLRQPIFRGGILWNTLLQEKVELEVAEKEYEAALGDLINDVSAAYFEYNRAVQVAREQKAVTENLQRYAKISRQKFKEEIISEIEHLNVQSLASQVKYDYETAKQEVELAKLELQKYLDLDIQDEIEISPLYDLNELILQGEADDLNSPGYDDYASLDAPEKELNMAETGPNLSELVDLAYSNRPELQVEAARLQSARLEERVRWGELLPQMDFILEFGKLAEAFDANSVDPAFRKDVKVGFEVNWNAMGNNIGYEFANDENAPTASDFTTQGGGSQVTRNTLTVDIFDGLDDYADAKDAEVAKLDQIIELEETEKEVMLDVKQAYFDFQKAKIQVESTLQRVSYRNRLAKLAEHRLGKNEIQISEFLQGEIDLQQELGTLHRALAEFFTAKAKLNHAIGVKDYLKIEETNVR